MSLQLMAIGMIVDKHYRIEANVNTSDTVTSVVVTNDLAIELEVTTPSGENIINRAVYPPGTFTTNIPPPKRFLYSTYEWGCSISTRS